MRRSWLSKPGRTESIEDVVCGSIVSDGSETALIGSICETSVDQIGRERPMSEDQVGRAPKSPEIYAAEKVGQGTIILRKRSHILGTRATAWVGDLGRTHISLGGGPLPEQTVPLRQN
jgi:hypothetical protein